MEKVSYSLGVNVAKSVKNQGLKVLMLRLLLKRLLTFLKENELKISEQESNRFYKIILVN